eukprot:1062244-Pyramimonas_sp.AAC.1
MNAYICKHCCRRACTICRSSPPPPSSRDQLRFSHSAIATRVSSGRSAGWVGVCMRRRSNEDMSPTIIDDDEADACAMLVSARVSPGTVVVGDGGVTGAAVWD